MSRFTNSFQVCHGEDESIGLLISKKAIKQGVETVIFIVLITYTYSFKQQNHNRANLVEFQKNVKKQGSESPVKVKLCSML